MALQKIILTFFKLKNYVFELYGFTSIPLRFGSRKIFLLLNYSSHDPHFLICQNIETLDRTQKFQIFLFTGFPDNWLQTWLSRRLFWLLFLFFVFFCFSSSRSRAMRSPCHNFSKILSNRNEILQTWSEVNIVVPNTFWVHSVEGCRSWGTSKWKNILRFSPCFFRQSFKHLDFHEDIYLQNPNGWTDFDAQ